jgi:hypothetical protein
MIQDFTTLTVPGLVADAEAVARDAQTAFGKLSAEQLNWKPTPESWSVAQCLEHLLVANREMFPVITAAASGAHQATVWERMPVLPSLMGRFMVKAVSPAAKLKVKAPAKIRPSASTLDPQIVTRFVEHQSEVVAHLKRLAEVDAAQLVVTSPLSSAVIYSLLDAGRIIVAHQRRHLAQAERVMQSPGFPQ